MDFSTDSQLSHDAAGQSYYAPSISSNFIRVLHSSYDIGVPLNGKVRGYILTAHNPEGSRRTDLRNKDSGRRKEGLNLE